MWTCNIRYVPVSAFLVTYRIDIYFSASKIKKVKKKIFLSFYIPTHNLLNLEVLFKNYFAFAGEPVTEMWN